MSRVQTETPQSEAVHDDPSAAEPGAETSTGAARPPETIEVRRNAALGGFLALAGATLAVGFGLRAVDGGGMLDWILFGAMTVVGVLHLAGLLDSRAPLLVADDHGVRLREGGAWHGIGWREVACLEYLPRRGFRDGHLLLLGRDEEQLVVPLTLATRVGGASTSALSDELAGMADGQTDVVEVVPGLTEDDQVDQDEAADQEGAEEPEVGPEQTDGDVESEEDSTPAAVATLPATRSGEEPRAGSDHWTEVTADVPRLPSPGSGVALVGTEPGAPAPAAPLADRGRRAVGRVSSLLHRALPHPRTDGATALDHAPVTDRLPEADELVRPEVVHPAEEDATPAYGVRVVADPAPHPAETSTTRVIDDLAVAPATDPVIGRELLRSRERLRLSVDQLSERTRIRPHVIEAMENDDFAACGGDFYARGHLRTISRVLGVESAPLVAAYDERYADAPIDPKRVFESELATGTGGAIRGTRGGRNWSVLVAAVMAAVLVWSVARLVMDGPAPVGDAPVLNQSGGITQQAPQAEAVPVTLTAVGGGAKLVVRDGGGDIVFDGRLAFGQSTELEVPPPVRISSTDGSVTASLDGAEAAPLGETGEDVTKTLVP